MGYHCFKPHLHALEAAAAKDDREGPFARPWHTVQLQAVSSIALRHEANDCVLNSNWDGAVELYDKLLAAEPWLPQGYIYRAIILLNRGWRGDALCALRDADTCVALSPNWPKAYETRIRCLKDLDQVGPSMILTHVFSERSSTPIPGFSGPFAAHESQQTAAWNPEMRSPAFDCPLLVHTPSCPMPRLSVALCPRFL
jgi:hypothetical protein